MVFDNNTVSACFCFVFLFFLDLENNIRRQYYCKILRRDHAVICFNGSQEVFCNAKWNICLQIEFLCLHPSRIVNKLINMTFAYGWEIINSGQGECSAAILSTPYRADCFSRGNVDFLQCQRTWRFSHLIPTPCSHVVLFGLVLCPFLCPHLYWAEYFYVANVVKVFFISLFCILVTWFCLLQIKAAMGFPHSQFDPHGICVLFLSKRSSGNALRHGFR